ncbi:aspartate/methionine/tyrosine aminotransferase [Thioalkalivibrio sp. ALE21]|uniref:aminotransferase class I/II-fold pyridoxal phosphate-dependent enzyme n=1 Tax=Thioalkalivibrio sp. ALE21 TaxID=1158175 RepID=UPI000D9835A6|nr:aminotransferase class I/II-fold pyridoxal phosphate-dependent enzyme [Thioalkalivibrio sp. ALE21]PYG00777.1 aspartate/methionine/tyrosine aminotransferase [Thioalkalivibrio sp. ALE21]
MSASAEPALSDFAQVVEPFRVMDILDRAQAAERAGRDIIHLEVGEPDFVTPRGVVSAGEIALAAGETRYTPAHGREKLRRAIAQDYRNRHAAEVDPERVVVTSGASAAILLALAAGVNPGEGVLLPDPGYACNRQFVAARGARPRPLVVSAEDAWQPTAAAVAAAWSDTTRAVLLASPANPTGTCLSRGTLAEIVAVVEARGGLVIMDEIYGQLVFGEPERSAAALHPNVVVINSFSKYFAMTGWRLGWMVVPPSWVDPVRRLAQNLFVAPSSVAQAAAMFAFEPDTEAELQQRVRELESRRDFLLQALPELGLEVRARPEGAFYIYADCSAHGADSEALCARILDEAGVALTPGTDFSPSDGARHLRIAYTQSEARLREAVERLRGVLT